LLFWFWGFADILVFGTWASPQFIPTLTLEKHPLTYMGLNTYKSFDLLSEDFFREHP
jgi:hypothetical protein